MMFVTLLSGGIDSPVAAHMMLERGADMVLLHMDNRPYGGLEHQLTKVRQLAGRLERLHGRKLRLLVSPHGHTHEVLLAHCKRNLHCVLCRRMMLRVAGELAKRDGAAAIVTGESLGQVASQTLQNIAAEFPAAPVPILRPLIGLDKQEIVETAKKIGTYELSIQPGGCCTAVPSMPATRASRALVEEEEKNIDMASLVRFSLEKLEELPTLGL